jgi:hypothetical protein
MKGLLLSLSVVIGCSRTPTNTASATTPSATAVSSAAFSTAVSSPTASSAAPASPSSPPPMASAPASAEDAALATTRRWNAALAARDVDALRSVYATTVRMYGVSMSRENAVKSKAAWLAKVPDYKQSIGVVAVDTTNSDRVSTSFQKTWTAGGKQHVARGRLDFGQEDGRWVVVDESDGATDVRLAIGPDACAMVATELVASTREAKDLLNGPTDPDAGHASNGLRAWGVSSDDPTEVMVAVHENHEDHLATLGWFKVNIRDGSVRSDEDDRRLEADRAVAARVVATCSREKPGAP